MTYTAYKSINEIQTSSCFWLIVIFGSHVGIIHTMSSTFCRLWYKRITIFLDKFLYFDRIVCVYAYSIQAADRNCISHRIKYWFDLWI